MKLKTLRLLIRDFLIIYQNPTKITETQEVLQWSGYVSCIGTCVQCPSRAIQWQLDVFHVSFSSTGFCFNSDYHILHFLFLHLSGNQENTLFQLSQIL